MARKKHIKPADSERDRLLADQAVALAECAAEALVAAEQLGIKTRPVDGLSLQESERAVLSVLPAIPARVKKKLAKAVANFTLAEVAGMTMAVAEWLPEAETEHQLVLLLLVMKLMDSLRTNLVVPEETAQATEPKRITIIPRIHGKLTRDHKMSEPDIDWIMAKWLERHPEVKGRERDIQIVRGTWTLSQGRKTEVITVSIVAGADIEGYDLAQDADLYAYYLAEERDEQ